MARKKAKPKKTALNKPPRESFISKHPFLFTTILAFVLLLILYYPLVIGGKTVQTPDKMTSLSHRPFFQDAAKRGIFPLWTPYIFSGMPSYGSMLGIPKVNVIDSSIHTVLNAMGRILPNPGFTFIFLNYLFFALFMYALMRSQKVKPIASLFSAIAVIFIPQFVAFTAYGHNTKFLSLMLIPLIFLFATKLVKEKNILYFSLTALAIGFQMMRAHVQVSYYTFLMLGIYFIVEAVASWREGKQTKSILGSGALLLGAIIIGVALSSVIYMSVMDYQHYSIRGGQGGGLDFGYASNWSFHPLEMITFIIPSFMGFGGQTYWGKMPFTDYPLYFSIIVFLLAIIPFILKRDKFTWFLGILALFSLFVSFGKYLPILYTPMFKFLPYFNKFRVPSMIHILLDISLVALAGYGLQALIEFRGEKQNSKEFEKRKKALTRYFTIFAIIVGVFTLFMLLGKSVYTELVAGSRSYLKAAQRDMAYNKALWDSFKSIIFLAAGIFLILQFLKNKISQTTTGIFLVLLAVIDLWFVDFKIIKPQPPASEAAYFAPTPAVNFIKQDKSLYRIFPVLDTKGGNWYMYHFLQNINGYSAAKLRIYQEFLEETGFNTQDQYRLNPFISKYWRYAVRENKPTWVPVPVQQIDPKRLAFHNAMLDMLNVKYLIESYLPLNDPKYTRVQNQQPWVYENTGVLPRAFFVDSVKVLSGRRSIFDYMKNGTFNPAHTAIIEEEPPFAISAADSDSVQVTAYDIHLINLQAKVKKPALMVLSEIYYPAGWKAFVDGKETKIYKTNYILRSIFLQPGSHKIEFRFAPKSFMRGVWTSVIVLILLLGMLIAGLVLKFRNSKNE